MSAQIFEPFKTGNVYKMRHGGVWATFLMSDQLFYQLERSALDQIRNTMELPGVKSLTITPDAHTGYGFAIGSVVESDTHLYPDVVGPDPACSVGLSKLPKDGISSWGRDNKETLINSISQKIGFGRQISIHRLSAKEFKYILRGEMRPEKSWINAYDPLWRHQNSEEYKKIMKVIDSKLNENMLKQLGTIGGGNHFVEIQEDEDGNNYLMTHFGSRGIGAAVAKWFDNAIEEELKKWNGSAKNGLLFVPYDSSLGQMYYMFQLAMLEWASFNHHFIHMLVAKELGESSVDYLGHVPHNFIEQRNGKFVGRKGATPAYDFEGIPLLIPGSMATGSYVLRPGENAKKLGESVSHGAGRVLSRGKAKENLDQETVNLEFEAAGVIGNFTDVPLDESHGAYKDVDEVIQSLVDAGVAEVEMRLKPVIALKGT